MTIPITVTFCQNKHNIMKIESPFESFYNLFQFYYYVKKQTRLQPQAVSLSIKSRKVIYAFVPNCNNKIQTIQIFEFVKKHIKIDVTLKTK